MPVRAARDRNLEVLVGVNLDVGGLLAEQRADDAGSVREVERDRELVVDDLRRGVAYDEVDGGSGPGEAFEEPASVGGSGGAGEGDDESAVGHSVLLIATQAT